MDPVLEPIVILAMPRSGSSMTAGLFARHGCWSGFCHKGCDFNARGHHENLDIKAILIRRFGRLAQTTTPAEPQEGFMNEVLKLNPTPPWMVKHSAMYRRAWHEFAPRFVCVRRKHEGIIGSNLKVGFLGTRDRERMMEIIEAHEEQMDLSGGVDVYPDELIEGNYDSICNALEHCGIEPNLKIMEDFVEPSLWQRWLQ